MKFKKPTLKQALYTIGAVVVVGGEIVCRVLKKREDKRMQMVHSSERAVPPSLNPEKQAEKKEKKKYEAAQKQAKNKATTARAAYIKQKCWDTKNMSPKQIKDANKQSKNAFNSHMKTFKAQQRQQ